MADVPLRHRPAPRRPRPEYGPKPSIPTLHSRPFTLFGAAVIGVVAAGCLVWAWVEITNDSMALSGLESDPTLIELAIGAETLAIPANMIRSARTRRGGPVERADLALHWPGLAGYSEELAAAFREGAPLAPIVYATIAARDAPLDSTGRLDSVYARLFAGKALPGPAGLVGRELNAESGYAGEIVYFAPSEPRPFVARCLAESTPEMPATCLRDVNFGRGLSLLYRFDRKLMEDWRALDAAMRELATGFLAP